MSFYQLFQQLSQHWTPQQAFAVYQCLEHLLQTIWQQHEHELSNIFAAEFLSSDESHESTVENEFDDSIPF